MTYRLFKNESETIASLYEVENLEDLSFASIQGLCHEYIKLVGEMLDYINTTTEETKLNSKEEMEQKLLRATRGVFKYMTISSSKAPFCYTSAKNKFVQVGYLDLDNNIVFNEVKRPAIDESDVRAITRFLPGFHVRGYRSCEEYIPSLTAPSQVTKEIREVVSTTVIQYSSSSYSLNHETYSVIGFLNDSGELIKYSQIIED